MSVSDGRVTVYIKADDYPDWQLAQTVAEKERRSLSFIVSEALHWFLSTRFDKEGKRVQ